MQKKLSFYTPFLSKLSLLCLDIYFSKFWSPFHLSFVLIVCTKVCNFAFWCHYLPIFRDLIHKLIENSKNTKLFIDLTFLSLQPQNSISLKSPYFNFSPQFYASFVLYLLKPVYKFGSFFASKKWTNINKILLWQRSPTLSSIIKIANTHKLIRSTFWYLNPDLISL